jgi:pyridoxine 5-phosphate synthase
LGELIVSIDLVANIRYLCGQSGPKPSVAAMIAELSGVDGVSAHLRSDRKGLRRDDIRMIRNIIQTKLWVKMKPSAEMVGFALDLKPDTVELISEKQKQAIADEPVDLIIHKNNVAEAVEALQSAGIGSSILVEPDPEQVKMAHFVNAAMVRVYTGNFVESKNLKKINRKMSDIVNSVKLAHRLGLGTIVGGGLNYETIKSFRGLSEIDAFHIGRGIISRALLVGLEKAIKEMAASIRQL